MREIFDLSVAGNRDLVWEVARTSLAPSRSVRAGAAALEKRGGATVYAARVPPACVAGEAFARFAGVPRFAATNSILVTAVRGAQESVCVLVLPGGSRADLNGQVRKLLGVRRVSLAGEERLIEAGMQKGAVGPIGVPETWPVLIDARLVAQDAIFCGGGALDCKLKLRGRDLRLLPGATVCSLVKAEST